MDLKIQYVLGRHRADFAIPDKKIAIEVDGHAFHSSAEQRRKDAKKQRAFQKKGWCLVRFTGHEVYHAPEMCITDTKRIIDVFSKAERIA